jgi:hypothetical protein
MSYAEIFAFLLALLAKAPAIIAWLQAGADLLAPAAETMQLVSLTPEEEAAEAQLTAALSADNALFDGSGIRRLAKFVKDNPELVAMLKSLFLK